MVMSEYKTAEEAERAAEARAEEEGYIDFDGQNCGDYREDGFYCAGWDGSSRRCDCGNRRVYWEPHQHEDGTWTVSAVAW